MIQRILLSLTLSAASFAVMAQDTSGQDTAPSGDDKVTELSEIVVTGDNVWIEGNKVIFKPQKSAKNLATDAISLIERMNTGLLSVKDGEIISYDGRGVTVFINGVKADGMDLSTFWPKNAIRVEYFESSDDPRFAGCSRVVNFIMKEYVSGGLTKIDGSQTFPNTGNYSLSSKLVYGKMTYNAIFSGGYNRDHLSGDDRKESYRDIWYDGQHYDLVERNEKSDMVNRQDKLYGGFNARYRTGSLLMTHSAGLQWIHNPESTVKGLVEYTPGIIDANAMRSLSRSRSLAPTVNGNYKINNGGKLAYEIGWKFSHTHNNTFSEYSELAYNPILTRIRENVYNYMAGANIWWKIRSNMWGDLTLKESRTISVATYTGTTPSDQWQQNGSSLVRLRWQYCPVDQIYISIAPQLDIQDWNVDHKVKKTELLPSVEASVSWTVNRNNTLSLNVYGYQVSPFASMRNDLILRQTELKWIEGNPSLKAEQNYLIYLNWYYRISSWLSSSLSSSFSSSQHDSYLEYRPGGENYDGVVGQYKSAGDERNFHFGWSLDGKLLDGKLNVGNQLQYGYSSWSYDGSPKLGWWYTRPYITWYFGNCSLMATYNSPQKYARNGGHTMIYNPYQCGLSFSYGNGNFNLNISADNIFNKKYKSKTWFDNGAYQYVSHNWEGGRSIRVRLTYTFDYGKKVNPGIEISTENIQTTTVLGTSEE